MFDSRGVVVRWKSVRLSRGVNTVELSMVDLAGGVYMVQVQNGDGEVRSVVVVRR